MYTSTMLYMIGGPPRMGKSSLAQLILNRHNIPYVSTDGLTVMLKPIGQPSFYSPKKSERFFPYLELFIDRMLKSVPDYLIEGDAFSPQHVKKLEEKYKLKSVFLTMSKVNPESIIKHTKFDRWTDDVHAEELSYLCERITAASKDIQAQCNHVGARNIDLSQDYDQQIKAAYEYLMN